MTTSLETTKYRHVKGVLGCFTTSKRGVLLYGRLLHNIGFAWSDDYGTFFLEDGTVQTYGVKFVDQVTLRLTQGDLAFSEYLQGAVKGDIRLRHAEQQFNASRDAKGKEESASESNLQNMMNTSLALFRKKYPLKPPKPPQPERPKSLFPVKSKTRETKVAGRTGSKAHYRLLQAETKCGWCVGTLLKFDPGDVTPYTVRWNTKPPQNMMVSASTIKQLVANYTWCNTREVFAGIVGREVLWPTFKGNVAILRYTKVIGYDPVLKLYDLSFRDGIIFQITPESLDEVTDRHDLILKGGEVVVDDAQKISRMVRYTQIHVNHAQQEKQNYKIQGPVLLSTNKDGSDFSTDTDNVDESANNSESSPQASKASGAVKSARKVKNCFAALTVKESQSNPNHDEVCDDSESDEEVPLTQDVAILMQRETKRKEKARSKTIEDAATLEAARLKAIDDAATLEEAKLVQSASEAKVLQEQQEAARLKGIEDAATREQEQKDQAEILMAKAIEEAKVVQAQ
jgi:hypothetical protein